MSQEILGVKCETIDDDAGDLARLAVDVVRLSLRHGNVRDLDTVECRIAARCSSGLHLGGTAPNSQLPRPLRSVSSVTIGSTRAQLAHFEAPPQERDRREIKGLDALRCEHLRLLPPRCIAERHVVQDERRHERQLELDGAANREIAARLVFHVRLDRREEVVDVDGPHGDRERPAAAGPGALR